MSCSKFRYEHCEIIYKQRKEKNADHLYRLLLLHCDEECGNGTYVAKKMKPQIFGIRGSLGHGKYLKKLKKVAEEAWARYEKNQGKEISMALALEKLQWAFPIITAFLAMEKPFDDEMEEELQVYMGRLKASQKVNRARNKASKIMASEKNRLKNKGRYIYIYI